MVARAGDIRTGCIRIEADHPIWCKLNIAAALHTGKQPTFTESDGANVEHNRRQCLTLGQKCRRPGGRLQDNGKRRDRDCGVCKLAAEFVFNKAGAEMNTHVTAGPAKPRGWSPPPDFGRKVRRKFASARRNHPCRTEHGRKCASPQNTHLHMPPASELPQTQCSRQLHLKPSRVAFTSSLGSMFSGDSSRRKPPQVAE